MALVYQYTLLTPVQLKQALTLSPETKMLLQNIESEVVEMKLKLRLDLTNVQAYAQSEAALAGKLELLRELINPNPEMYPTTEEA